MYLDIICIDIVNDYFFNLVNTEYIEQLTNTHVILLLIIVQIIVNETGEWK